MSDFEINKASLFARNEFHYFVALAPFLKRINRLGLVADPVI